MTENQKQYLRRSCESKIAGLLAQLESDTDCRVAGVTTERMECTTIADTEAVYSRSVAIDLQPAQDKT